MTLLVGVLMGTVATVLVGVAGVILALSRATRFGPLRILGKQEDVVLMFDLEEAGSTRRRLGLTRTTTFVLSPRTTREIAARMIEVADDVESGRTREA